MDDEVIEATAAEDERYGLDARTVSAILLAVAAGDAGRLGALLEPLHPADIADLLEQVDGGRRREILLLGPRFFDGEVLSELDEALREEVITFLPADVLAEAVRELDSDDVVDLLEDLEPPQQEAILDALEIGDRIAVEQALTYPEYSAGRLMQREVVRAPEHWSVGETIDHLRASKKTLPDQFYHVIVVDPGIRPVGYVTLGKLLSSKRSVRLADLLDDSFRTIPVTQPESEVAYAFNQYHLISAPVVDDGGRLVGVITIDDAMNVLDEEYEEDMLRLAGVGEGSLNDRVMETTRQRVPWLFVNLLSANVSAFVISQFEDSIAQIVALAVLMPIIASMGGNAGTQTMTVAVRALATKDLTDSNVFRVVRRELAVGLINGVTFALMMGGVGLLWFGSTQLGLVIAAAMIINLGIAALAGILIPVMLDKFGIDPALASGTFVMTVTDVVGFSVFLGLATVVLL